MLNSSFQLINVPPQKFGENVPVEFLVYKVGDEWYEENSRSGAILGWLIVQLVFQVFDTLEVALE